MFAEPVSRLILMDERGPQGNVGGTSLSWDVGQGLDGRKTQRYTVTIESQVLPTAPLCNTSPVQVALLRNRVITVTPTLHPSQMF